MKKKTTRPPAWFESALEDGYRALGTIPDLERREKALMALVVAVRTWSENTDETLGEMLRALEARELPLSFISARSRSKP